MKKYLSSLLSIALMLSFSASLFAGANDKILGKWYNTEKSGIIEIYECSGKLCGKIVWLKEPLDNETKKPKVDKNNPEMVNRNMPIIGLNVLSGFVKSGDNVWEDGKIYDPKNGKTYSCKMTLSGDDLDVRGYIGFSLFGRTEHWTRAK